MAARKMRRSRKGRTRAARPRIDWTWDFRLGPAGSRRSRGLGAVLDAQAIAVHFVSQLFGGRDGRKYCDLIGRALEAWTGIETPARVMPRARWTLLGRGESRKRGVKLSPSEAPVTACGRQA